MAIGHVVTRGYGTGTFAGDVNLVVVRGFLLAAAVTGTATNTIDALGQSASGLLQATGTASNTVDAIAQAVSGDYGPSGTASSAINAISQSASGTFAQGITGTASNAVNAIAQSATGLLQAEGSVSSTVDAIGQSAAGDYGPSGTASSSINSIAQSASGSFADYTGTASNAISALAQSASGTFAEGDTAPARRGGGYLPPRKKRKPRKPEWEKRDEEKRELEQFLERAYEEITGEAPATLEQKKVTREAVATVRPYSPGKSRRPPTASKVDFEALASNLTAAKALIDLLERKRELDEEDAIVVVLL